MSEIPKKKNYSESAFNAIGGFFGSLFDIYTGLFDLLERTLDAFEKAFDDLPLGRLLIVLAVIGILVYYVVIFHTFNGAIC